MAAPSQPNRAMPSSRRHRHRYRQSPADIDIVWEVLLRLPVKSLLRFKSACKSWRALISDPCFVSSHCEHSRRKPKIIIRPITSQDYSTNSDWGNLALYSYCEEQRDLELLFEQKLPTAEESLRLHPYHLNGLIVLYSPSYIHVSNPSTRELITLPQKNHRGCDNRTHCDGLGHDPASNRYKAVDLFVESDRTLGCRVFTIGVDDSWRVVADVPQAVSVLQHPVPLDGVLYWRCAKDETPLTMFDLTMAFDLRDETFRFVPLPEEAICCFLLLPMGKRLCMFGFSLAEPQQIVIWALRDSDHAWIKKYSIACRSNRFLMKASHGDDDDNLFIRLRQQDLVYYNLPTRRQRLLESTSYWDFLNKQEMLNLRSSVDIEHFHAILYAESLTSITN